MAPEIFRRSSCRAGPCKRVEDDFIWPAQEFDHLGCKRDRNASRMGRKAGVSACFGVSLVSRVRDLENVGGDAAAVINREAALAGRVSRRFLASLGAAIFDQSEHTIRIWLEDRLVVRIRPLVGREPPKTRSEEHTSELQSLMRISYAV